MELAGRLHPLIVHLPIGFLFAAFVFELLHRYYPSIINVRSVRILIGFSAISAILSVLSGLLLSLSGAGGSTILSYHKWGGIVLAVLASIFYFVRKADQQKKIILVGWSLLLLLLTWTGHMGGSLTHGQSYLLDASPKFIQTLFANEGKSKLSKPLDSALVFEDIIMPIVEQKCQSCHGSEKRKGGLDLSNANGWRKGGKSGELLLTGKANESLLIRRILLSEDDKKHMPPKGHSQIIASEFALLEWWINEGAHFENKLAHVEKDQRISFILESAYQRRESSEMVDVPSYSESRLTSLQQAGIRILPAALESNQLEVSFARDSVISDQHIKELRKLQENVVRIDFSFSGINNDQLENLKEFENLRFLSFAGTNISCDGIAQLADFEHLEYLNFHSTQISDACLETLANLSNLKKLFVWNTNISVEALQKFRSQRPDVLVNL